MKHFFFNSNIYIYQQDSKWKNKEINIVRDVLKATNVKKNGLSIKLSNDKHVKYYNYKWKGINKPTNVLSFACSDQEYSFDNNVVYLGDIIIAYETLKKEIKKRNIDFHSHLSHILIHGILHLKGFTHNNVDDTRKMQNEEKRILQNLKIKNPYRI